MTEEPENQQEQEQQQTAESAPQGETEQAAASAAAEPIETQSESEQQPEQGREPRKGGVQRRIDELTKKAYLAEAEAKFYRDLAEKKARGEPQEAVKAKPDEPKPEPKAEDFETQEEYLKAVRTWDREQIKAEVKAEIEQFGKQQQEHTEAEQRQAEWSEKEEAAVKAHADYAEVTAAAFRSLAGIQGPAIGALAHAIEYSEAGPELLYHLGQNPEELESLVALHPTRAVIALGRLEARLTEKEPSGDKAVPQQTRAPRPPTPIRTTSASSKPRPDDPESDKAMTDDEWMRARDKQVRERASR